MLRMRPRIFRVVAKPGSATAKTISKTITIAATTCSWLSRLRPRHQGAVLVGVAVVTDAISRFSSAKPRDQ